jgi:acetoin utilization protein AcuB
MEIQEWMKHPVQCVKPLDSIVHAREIMEAHRVNQLPVVVDRCVVGIITDRDLRAAFPSVFDSATFNRHKAHVSASDPKAITVEMVMTPHVLTLGPHDSIVEAARLMRRERLGALPIVERDRLVGLITRSDVLDAFVELSERRAAPESSDSTNAAHSVCGHLKAS